VIGYVAFKCRHPALAAAPDAQRHISAGATLRIKCGAPHLMRENCTLHAQFERRTEASARAIERASSDPTGQGIGRSLPIRLTQTPTSGSAFMSEV